MCGLWREGSEASLGICIHLSASPYFGIHPCYSPVWPQHHLPLAQPGVCGNTSPCVPHHTSLHNAPPLIHQVREAELQCAVAQAGLEERRAELQGQVQGEEERAGELARQAKDLDQEMRQAEQVRARMHMCT